MHVRHLVQGTIYRGLLQFITGILGKDGTTERKTLLGMLDSGVGAGKTFKLS